DISAQPDKTNIVGACLRPNPWVHVLHEEPCDGLRHFNTLAQPHGQARETIRLVAETETQVPPNRRWDTELIEPRRHVQTNGRLALQHLLAHIFTRLETQRLQTFATMKL